MAITKCTLTVQTEDGNVYSIWSLILISGIVLRGYSADGNSGLNGAYEVCLRSDV